MYRKIAVVFFVFFIFSSSAFAEEQACLPGFIKVEPGTFQMGTPDDQFGYHSGLSAEEIADMRYPEPLHDVTITQPFCLQKTEIIQRQWEEVAAWVTANKPDLFFNFMEPNPLPRGHSFRDPDLPLVHVNWYDLIAFANALSVRKGLTKCYRLARCAGAPGDRGAKYEGSYVCNGVDLDLSCTGFRLPTAAEWEYAARAGTETATYNGDLFPARRWGPYNQLDEIAWHGFNTVHGYCPDVVALLGLCPTVRATPGVRWLWGKFSDLPLHKPCLKMENPWGFCDMIGNALEWVEDWYVSEPGFPSDPRGPVIGIAKEQRGCMWGQGAINCRAGMRIPRFPHQGNNLGFGGRLVQNLPK